MLNINNVLSMLNKYIQMFKSNITFTFQNMSVLVHVCSVLLIVYICVCKFLLQNNNHKTKQKNTFIRI